VQRSKGLNINERRLQTAFECALAARIVHKLVGANGAARRKLSLGRCTCDDSRAKRLANRDGGHPDTSGRTKDYESLALFQTAQVYHPMPNSTIVQLKAGGDMRIDTIRYAEHLSRVDERLLSEATTQGCAKDAITYT
jgi:hypothetical protein